MHIETIIGSPHIIILAQVSSTLLDLRSYHSGNLRSSCCFPTTQIMTWPSWHLFIIFMFLFPSRCILLHPQFSTAVGFLSMCLANGPLPHRWRNSEKVGKSALFFSFDGIGAVYNVVRFSGRSSAVPPVKCGMVCSAPLQLWYRRKKYKQWWCIREKAP